MPPARSDQTSRDTALVNAGIVLSRIVGLVRQRVLAHYLGTSAAADAVMAAFRIGNVTQNLLGEGALSASFVPVYLRLKIEGQGAHARFARATLGWLMLVVTAISVLGALFAPLLAAAVAPGFEGFRLELTTRALRVLFPMTGVLVLGAWSLAILSANRRFLLGYMAPVAWSVAQILAVLVAGIGLHMRGADIAMVVAWGALGGAVTQLVVMAVPVRKILGGIAPTFERGAPGVREGMSKLPSAVLGRGVIQLSGLVDTLLVSFLGPGAVSTFTYAQTIYLLPMALLGPGEAAVSLVDFSEKRATLGENEAKQEIVRGLGRALSRVFALALGATVAFIALGPEVVAVLFQGGSFDADSTRAVALVLAAYGPGLPANAASRLFGTACFALGDTRRPAVFAAIRVVTSTVVSLVVMRWLGVAGVVIGAAFAAWVELALLVITVKRELGATGLGLVRYAPMVVSALALGAAGLGARYGLAHLGLRPVPTALAVVAAAGLAFLFVADRSGALSVRSLIARRRG
ncbi:MAG TPA: murein biosynthesis integral membrane protein MurJ [Polyangiaceae bacterium]|nr:murein biosynthesis integral membrane protein MurJ [Polyangiaceae bacterium]